MPIQALPLPIKNPFNANGLGLNPAFKALEALYERLNGEIGKLQLTCDMSGVCCDFVRTDHKLYATVLEISYFLHHSEHFSGVDENHCPYFLEGKCEARKGRVLGCRVYFCMNKDASGELYESFFKDIKYIHKKYDIEYLYVPVFKYLAEHSERKGR